MAVHVGFGANVTAGGDSFLVVIRGSWTNSATGVDGNGEWRARR